MPRVVKVTQAWRFRPSCTANVHLAAVPTNTPRRRIARAVEVGRDPNHCGMVAAYLVDGKPRCLSHAGQAALRILPEDGR